MSEVSDYWKPQLEKADRTISELSREIERLREKVAILEAELRVAYKLPAEVDRRMSEQGL